MDPLTLFVVELFCFGVKSTDSISMLIYEANLISQVTAFNHNWESLPLASLDINLLNVGRKPRAEASAKDHNLVRLGAVASAVG